MIGELLLASRCWIVAATLCFSSLKLKPNIFCTLTDPLRHRFALYLLVIKLNKELDIYMCDHLRSTSWPGAVSSLALLVTALCLWLRLRCLVACSWSFFILPPLSVLPNATLVRWALRTPSAYCWCTLSDAQLCLHSSCKAKETRQL